MSHLSQSSGDLTIEIRGAGFQNKGAELMLHAVLQEVERWGRPVRPVVNVRNGSYVKRAKLGLFQKLHLDRLSKILYRAGGAVPTGLLDPYGMVMERDIDAVLDCSGFAYSDQWGAGSSEDLAAKSERWKRQGKKVVLLPQALGPFEEPATREAFVKGARNVDLIFARDDISYEHARDVCGSLSSLRQAPDFTCLVEGGDVADEFVGRVAVVPNVRMLDKTESSTSASYPDVMRRVLKALRDQGADPYILVHDSHGDYGFAEEIGGGMSQPVQIVREEDPLRIKGMLGAASVVVASRYHALVSALTQGVPVLATSWSHKYEELLGDFSMSRYLLPLDGTSDIEGLLEELSDPDVRGELNVGIDAGRTAYRRSSQEMWQSVRAVLSETPG